jgi:iron complex outermembrane receptor protein
MMLRCLLIIPLILSIHSSAQQVKGYVKDDQSKEMIIGAVVRCSGGGGTVTNAEGSFALDCTGDSLIVEYIGYSRKALALKEFSRGDGIISIAPMMNAFQTVVVSAGKFEQDINEVTVSMEVLKPDLVHDKNTVSAEDILQQTPGVSIVDKEPQIRGGSGYSFGAGSRVQILVDDMPALSGDAGRPNWDYLPVENISQIEVIKGASSVLYGSAALSGVIHFRTAYPGAVPKTVVQLYQGVFDSPRSSASKYWQGNLMRTGANVFHGQRSGNIDWIISANFVGDDGHLGPVKDTATGAFDNGYNPFTADRYAANTRGRVTGSIRVRSKKIEGLSFSLASNWNMSNSMGTLIWGNSDTALYGAFAGSATRTKQLLGTVDPSVSYFGKKGGRHVLRTRWQSLDNDNDNNQGNFSDQYYGEYQFSQDWSEWGISGLRSTVGGVSNSTYARGELFKGGNPDGRNTIFNRAAYIQLDQELLKKIHLSGGARFEQFVMNGVKSERPVYRAGMNIELAKYTFFRSSYGQGYRFPSVAEKFIVTGVGAINIFANPDLVPETSVNMEAGIRQGFRIGNFMGFADVSLFRQEYENFIEFTFAVWEKIVFQPGVNIEELFRRSLGFKSVNTGKARVDGAEFSLTGTGQMGKVGLDILAGYTYTQPVSLTPNQVYAKAQSSDLSDNGDITYLNTSSDTTGNILKYRMQHLVRADVNLRYLGWSLGGSCRYNSHMQNIDKAFEFLEENLPTVFNPGIIRWRADHKMGDYVVDTRLSYTFNGGHRAALVISNLLNREYAIRPLAIEEPRLFTFQYTFTFQGKEKS